MAVAELEEAKRLLRERLNKPSLYYVNLKAAEIYLRSGNNDEARNHLDRAVQQIQDYGKLSPADKDYLLDYSDLFQDDLDRRKSMTKARLVESEYYLVSKNIRDEFPINWK